MNISLQLQWSHCTSCYAQTNEIKFFFYFIGQAEPLQAKNIDEFSHLESCRWSEDHSIIHSYYFAKKTEVDKPRQHDSLAEYTCTSYIDSPINRDTLPC